MIEQKLRRFLLFVLSAAAGAGLFFLAFRFLLPWCLPFLPALLLAPQLEPVILYLQRRLRFRRGFSALLLTLTLLFLLGGLLSLLLSALRGQISALLAAAPSFLDALPDMVSDLLARLEKQCLSCTGRVGNALFVQLMQAVSQADDLLRALSSHALSALTSAAAALPGGALAVATAVLALYFTLSSYPTLCAALRRILPSSLQSRLRFLHDGATRSLAHWLRAYATLSLVTFCELLAFFALMRQRYALLLALLITLLDALPVFGTGTALVPWALIALLFGAPPKAIALLALYLCTLITRNILEPKLLSSHAGVPPVASLAAMYLGFCAFGIAGMLLFPFLLLLGMQLLHAAHEAHE